MNRVAIIIVLSASILGAETPTKNTAEAELRQVAQCFDRAAGEGTGTSQRLAIKNAQSCCPLMSQVCQCLQSINLTKKNKNVSRETEEPPRPILKSDGTQEKIFGYPLTENNLMSGVWGMLMGAAAGVYTAFEYVGPATYNPTIALLFIIVSAIAGMLLGLVLSDIIVKTKKRPVDPISGI